MYADCEYKKTGRAIIFTYVKAVEYLSVNTFYWQPSRKVRNE